MKRNIIGIYAPAPRSGKTVVAKHLCDNHDFTRVPFAGPLKRVAMAMLLELGITNIDLDGDKSMEVYKGVTLRHMLQTLGTEWGRDCLGQDVWLDCWRKRVDTTPGDIVADDVRFPNEARAIKDLGGVMWGVHRPMMTNDAERHASEGGLVGFQMDTWIINDGSLSDLHMTVEDDLAGISA